MEKNRYSRNKSTYVEPIIICILKLCDREGQIAINGPEKTNHMQNETRPCIVLHTNINSK